MPTDWYDLGLKPAEWKIYFNGENLSEEIKESMGTIVTKHHLNTKQLINTLTGENRQFVERVEKEQEENYGNYDIFEATLSDYYVEIQIGEQWLTVYFDGLGNIQDTSGTAQGGRYAKELLNCCIELHQISMGVDL